MLRKTIILVLISIKRLLGINLFPLLGFQVAKRVSLKSTILAGKISLGSDCNIWHSHLMGKIRIEKNTNITESSLTGTVNMNRNSKILDSTLSGSITIAENSIVKGAKINGNFVAGENLKLLGEGISIYGNVEVGRFTSLNGPNFDIYSRLNKVVIGSFCSVARNVAFQEYSHRTDRISTYYFNNNVFKENMQDDICSKGDIIVGNDVWIGTQSVILTGVSIGHGAIIAANSVISKDIPPYAIAAGSPAKVIKYRFSEEVIGKLLNLKWWDWDIVKIKENQVLFESDLSDDILSDIIN